MEKEIWKDVPGYEGYYQVSNLGNVKSIRLGSNLSLYIKRNYLNTSFNVNGIKKPYPVHQLVAMAFLGHKPCGYEVVVDHINNIKTDNRVENLQLISHRENTSKDRKNKTSKYTGVSWCRTTNKWLSKIHYEGKLISIGSFSNELEAYKYYVNALNSVNENNPIICKRREKSSDYKGVSFLKVNNKWKSQIRYNNNGEVKNINLGHFNTEEEAALAYSDAEKQIKKGVFNPIKKKNKYQYISFDSIKNKWTIKIPFNNKRKSLGYFNNEDDAVIALQKFKKNNSI